MRSISIVCANESSTLETVALRGVLEYFGYVPEVHWAGSTEQFKQLLLGNTKLAETVVLACHGCEKGFYGNENALIPLEQIRINLPAKTLLSLGCVTGTELFAKAFISGGIEYYIAPPSYPEGSSALILATIFLWKLHGGAEPAVAWEGASAILADSDDHFRIYRKIENGILVDNSREIHL